MKPFKYKFLMSLVFIAGTLAWAQSGHLPDSTEVMDERFQHDGDDRDKDGHAEHLSKLLQLKFKRSFSLSAPKEEVFRTNKGLKPIKWFYTKATDLDIGAPAKNGITCKATIWQTYEMKDYEGQSKQPPMPKTKPIDQTKMGPFQVTEVFVPSENDTMTISFRHPSGNQSYIQCFDQSMWGLDKNSPEYKQKKAAKWTYGTVRAQLGSLLDIDYRTDLFKEPKPSTRKRVATKGENSDHSYALGSDPAVLGDPGIPAI